MRIVYVFLSKCKTDMGNRLERESNAELLRIICILIILLHHFCVHALYPEVLQLNMAGYGWDSHVLLFMHAFLFIGVNCFILISGWFGIKPKWRSFINLYLIYAFYNLLHPCKHIAKALLYGDGFILPYSVHDIIMRVIFPFSHGHLWFMDCYLGLFLTAPLLNAAIVHLNKQQHAFVLLLLTIANVYFGDFWSMELINSYGYSLANFVYLYFIGSYLHKYISIETINNNRWKLFGSYCVFGLLWGVCSLLEAYSFHVPHWHAFAYNNPLLLLTAISFFLFMMSWHFKSKFVNQIAISMLGIYMLNEGVIKYGFLVPYAHQFTPVIQITFWFIVSIIFFIIGVCIDQVRIFLTKPFWKGYDQYIKNKGLKCLERIKTFIKYEDFNHGKEIRNS